MLLRETEDFSKALSNCENLLPSAVSMAGLAGCALVLWVFFFQNFTIPKNPGRNQYISRESTAWDEVSFPSKPQISMTNSCMLLQ